MDFTNHPCFDENAKHKYGRVHLPVAIKCNIQCNYCNRKYDCINESRPGVTSNVMTPQQALEYLKLLIPKNPSIKVVGIAGPGDPFANSDETMETLRLVRKEFSDIMLCVATNGLEILPHIDELAQLKVSHVTITLNTFDEKEGAKIYRWIRYNKKVYRGEEGFKILLNNQIEAIKKLKEKNIIVKVNTIVIPSINDNSIEETARKLSEMGVDILNIMPLYPVEDTEFASFKQPTKADLDKIRSITSKYIKQMTHCSRCRADAVGLIGEEINSEHINLINKIINGEGKGVDPCKKVAVASMEGLLINQHLGEADEFSIYNMSDGRINLLEKRKAPPSGTGDKRWEDLSKILEDCVAIFVQGCGSKPYNILVKKGFLIFNTSGFIEDVLKSFYKGERIFIEGERVGCGKGVSCSGTGSGCL